MNQSSILTGKVVTSGTGPNSKISKKLYIKMFPGEFSHRAPTPKKAKKLLGELLIRYSAREWPVKKNGSIIDDPGFLEGISELLKEKNVLNCNDLDYANHQHDLRDTITLKLGPKLTQEILDRGWAVLAK